MQTHTKLSRLYCLLSSNICQGGGEKEVGDIQHIPPTQQFHHHLSSHTTSLQRFPFKSHAHTTLLTLPQP
ncbi:hypothetical protein E2C01_002881 [Portunus trituberculatus]|uniref:Uncharacterized protein n=1 Tax=Portunus trituberculatus TaxID=210409 RepID=A0A5B7CL26_PORTR|nr:hypothetical protein [Portunus trituberculatus]